MTSSNGDFLIDEVVIGNVTLKAMMMGYTTTIVDSVSVLADTVTTVEISLMRMWPPGWRPRDVVSPAGDAFAADPRRPFEVDIPREWFAAAANFWVMHYRDVFAVVNNRSSKLRVTDKRVPNGWVNNLESVAEQLEPGTVYVDFACFEGPGGSACYGPGREDSFSREIALFLDDRKPENSTSDLDAYVLEFYKWGSRWDVRVYCRKPYSNTDRDRAFKMLRGLRFFELPIVNKAQAVGAAIKHLPPRSANPEER
jgi:hypothetical protein